MIEAQPIGWWNTGFPLAVLGGLAVLVPRWLVPQGARSQRVVAVAVGVSAAVLLVVGAV
ncbi:MAG: hypothetical protein GY717_13645, partial [Rhodobacteraceae bacterium]|nr:hypothetical protein [Paracoccaceae bacterium]